MRKSDDAMEWMNVDEKVKKECKEE